MNSISIVHSLECGIYFLMQYRCFLLTFSFFVVSAVDGLRGGSEGDAEGDVIYFIGGFSLKEYEMM